MGFKRTGAGVFEPVNSEVTEWRFLANLAQSIALGTSRKWGELKDRAGKARKLTVFGHESRGNVCIRLIEVAVETAESCEPHEKYPELERLACEVLRLCNGWDMVKKAQRHG